ncbi:MAG TPA: MOSC domain-containing protein [Nitrososphaeraceae archaeon]|nr:MOSC domain-containing protein [Nitrososphaeraceae archaeon]
MKVISVNVGLPIKVNFGREVVTTGIFKNPIKHRVKLNKLNFEGDKQADLTVHGGIDKAVYAYPSEHYEFWKKEIKDFEYSWGTFGENLTTEGLLENEVNIGDQFKIGSAKVIATQPRMPCYKLGVRFGRMDIVRRFMASERSGIYFKVAQEGEIGVNDKIELIKSDKNRVTIHDIVRLQITDGRNLELMNRAIKTKDLPEGWRNYFMEKLSLLK